MGVPLVWWKFKGFHLGITSLFLAAAVLVTLLAAFLQRRGFRVMVNQEDAVTRPRTLGGILISRLVAVVVLFGILGLIALFRVLNQ